MKVFGLIKTTGSAITLGLGFIPKRVRLSLVGGNATIDWDCNSNLAGKAGIVHKSATVDTTTTVTVAALTAGIAPYFSDGAPLDAASTAKLVPVSQVPELAGDVKGTIGKWTLTTAGNKTGKFDAGLDLNKAGVGSYVTIKAGGELYTARITALTNDGDANDEVTLDRAIPSGEVIHVGCNVDWTGCPAGQSVPNGIVISDTTHLNAASGSLISVEAE